MRESREPIDPDELGPFSADQHALRYNVAETWPTGGDLAVGGSDAFSDPLAHLAKHVRDGTSTRPTETLPSSEERPFLTFQRELTELEARYNQVCPPIDSPDVLYEQARHQYWARDLCAERLAELLEAELVVLRRVQESQKVRSLYTLLFHSSVFRDLYLHPQVQQVFLALHEQAHRVGIAPAEVVTDSLESLPEIGDPSADDDDTP